MALYSGGEKQNNKSSMASWCGQLFRFLLKNKDIYVCSYVNRTRSKHDSANCSDRTISIGTRGSSPGRIGDAADAHDDGENRFVRVEGDDRNDCYHHTFAERGKKVAS